MKKSVLLTRSAFENNALKKQLVTKFKCIDLSLLEYRLIPVEKSLFSQYTNIIITSKFAANRLSEFNIPAKDIWCVGIKSAEILQNIGHNICYCAANAESLRNQILQLREKSFLYLSANNITIEMPNFVNKIIFYQVCYKQYLNSVEKEKLKIGIDYILLYSTNCAKTLLQLLLKNDLLKTLENATIVAISSKVGKVVENYFSKVVSCCNSDQVIEYLEEL